MNIKYVKGDLFELLPFDEPTKKIIPHVCNDIGAWGSGFVVAVSKQWPMNEVGDDSPEGRYLKWHKAGSYHNIQFDETVPFVVGSTQIVSVDKRMIKVGDVERVSTTEVANMIAQHETIRTVEKPIRYAGLLNCMSHVASRCDRYKAMQGKWHNSPIEIHAPKFGADRAGGSWEVIESFIEEIWLSQEIPVTIYELD